MQRYGNRTQQQGMTLIEVMIAMTIGLVLTLIITTLFIGQNRSYQQNDATARMQENGRFALELLTQDLRHAGFFGDLSDPVDISHINIGDLPTAVTCLGGTKGLVEFSQQRFVLGYGDRINTTVGTSCITAADDINTMLGSGVLIVKRSAADPIADADLQNGVIYTYSSKGVAQMYKSDGGNLSSLANGESWEYQPRIYFIDSQSTLHRKMLSNGNLVKEPLAEGIDAFHIEFGIDTDGNGTPDYFYTPTQGNLSDATIDQAVSATIYVLARTTRADQDTDYSDDRTYNLGGITLGPFNDNFHRRVFTATTALKNFRAQQILRYGY